MISTRYALPVIVLLLLVLVPTVIHSYLGAKNDDGRIVTKIPVTLANISSKPFGRHNDSWVKDMFDSSDWIERIYSHGHSKTIRLFAARSYDHKRLYHHPELGLSHGIDLISQGIVTLNGSPEIHVHMLRRSDGRGVVAYALLYGNEFVQDPVKHQLAESLSLLVNPKRAMTLFYVDDASVSTTRNFGDTKSALLLRSAVDSFLSQEDKYQKN